MLGDGRLIQDRTVREASALDRVPEAVGDIVGGDPAALERRVQLDCGKIGGGGYRRLSLLSGED
jgi:hypothetical protein